MAITEPATRGHKKRERTRRQLIRAAIDVIAERGEAFAVSDVTERAGVANGTFYNYFDGREALLDAVGPEVLAGFAAKSAEEVSIEDPALRFATITALALERAVVAPDELRVALRLEAAQRALLTGGILDHLRADLTAGVAAGCFDVVVDDATVDAAVGGLLLAIRRIVEQGASPGYPARLIAQLLRSFGMAGPEAAAVAEAAVDQTVGLGESS